VGEETRASRAGRAVPREIKGVVFDLDDTLVESTVDYAKFKRLVIERLASYGEPRELYSPDETIVAIFGRFERRMREQKLPTAEVKRRLAELDRIMDSVELEHVSDTKEIRGALRLLHLLRDKGIKIGVLTRGCDEYARTALARTGMSGLIDAVECRNSDTPAKPNPEAYLKLVEALGLSKQETIFVGDHPIDAQCASNAGVPFVAVETGDVPEDDLRGAGCVAVFRDVGEMASWLENVLRA
jgi:HAD superfamily hydrolase (TIGR01549 family)